MKHFFSIVIPTLNEESFLPCILADLMKQKQKNFEIIIVDGDSEDKTKSIAVEFSRDLPIRFYTVARRSVSYQRNIGSQKAKGKYIVFLDADTRIYSSFTKRLASYITRTKGLIFIPAVSPDMVNSQTKVVFNLTNFLVEMSQNIGRPFSSGGSMIFEKNFFHLIGGFSEKVFMSEDHLIIQTAHKHGVHARFMRGIKIRISLRRMKKQGQLKLFYQYLLTASQYLIKGKVDRKVIEYQMGGHVYLQKTQSQPLEERIQKYLTEAKAFFKTLFNQ